jgi:hypothetical protein
MKLKLDQNLGSRAQQLFRQRGHEVVTVAEGSVARWPDGSMAGWVVPTLTN